VTGSNADNLHNGEEKMQTRISDLGKFEGCLTYVPYFYDLMLEGQGEDWSPEWENHEDEDEFYPTYMFSFFTVDAEDEERFEVGIGRTVMIWEDSQGFAYGLDFATREEAEAHARNWLGL
jgi:hypothetical protein